MRVGQVITIRNHDQRAATVGLFYVRPGETLTQRFTTPGRYEGACSVHPGGRFLIVVHPAA